MIIDAGFATADEMLESGTPIRCNECHRDLVGVELIHYDGSVHRCESCTKNVADELALAAEKFAQENLALIATPHAYDETFRFACSRRDYDNGNRESYTANSVRANNRHRCTNYDELLKLFDRCTLKGHVFHRVLWERSNGLVESAINKMTENSVDDVDSDEDIEYA